MYRARVQELTIPYMTPSMLYKKAYKGIINALFNFVFAPALVVVA
jgi:hypothetical protein